MFPSVRVPVLSVPRTVTDPSVSTAGSRRISALRADIRRAPKASASVTTAGSDSGTAATTRLIAVITISSTPWPRASPSASTMAHSATATTASARPTPARRRCSGVSPGWAPSSAATRPIELAAPVAVTTARPRPRTTTVPADTTSPRPPGPAAALSTGTDSPVSAASSTSSAAASITSASAGTMSPSASTSTSPATTSAAGICRCSPSRTTRASGAVRSDSAAMAWPALISWTTPTVVFTTITSTITSASARSPVATVSTTAASSTRISGSRNWPTASRQAGVRRARGSSFGPYRASRLPPPPRTALLPGPRPPARYRQPPRSHPSARIRRS